MIEILETHFLTKELTWVFIKNCSYFIDKSAQFSFKINFTSARLVAIGTTI